MYEHLKCTRLSFERKMNTSAVKFFGNKKSVGFKQRSENIRSLFSKDQPFLAMRTLSYKSVVIHVYHPKLVNNLIIFVPLQSSLIGPIRSMVSHCVRFWWIGWSSSWIFWLVINTHFPLFKCVKFNWEHDVSLQRILINPTKIQKFSKVNESF